LALGLYAVLLATHMGAVPGGADSSGYFNHARLLASGSVRAAARPLPTLPASQAPAYLYTPLGLKPAYDGNGLVPGYPPGFPLLILAAEPWVGWGRAADLVLGLHSLLGLLLVWVLARSFGLSKAWSLAAAGIVAASPLYLFLSLQALSDLPAMVWTLAAVLAAWHSRKREGWALAAGGALALAILVRPADFLAFAPVAVALSWPAGALASRIRRFFWFALGALPGAVFSLLHSRAAYGHFLATGYGDVRTDFGYNWVGVTLVHYAVWLPALFTPVVVLVFALPRVARSAPCAAAVLASWILSFAAFYSFYRFTHETWWYLRFLLPAAPALVVGGLLGLRSVLPGKVLKLPRVPAAALALGAIATAGIAWSSHLGALEVGRQEEIYPKTVRWLQAELPAQAAVLCMQVSGAVYFDTSFRLLRWDQIDARSRPIVLAALKSAHCPLYAALFPFETAPALKRSIPGRWTQIGSVDYATIWRWDGGGSP
jgi:4-amino-4-deoxy-L-arabinose transferase-like glycosyltransferase